MLDSIKNTVIITELCLKHSGRVGELIDIESNHYCRVEFNKDEIVSFTPDQFTMPFRSIVCLELIRPSVRNVKNAN